MTQDAVLQFQKAHDLVADGWAGDTTHAAMQLALAEKPKLATQRAAAAGSKHSRSVERRLLRRPRQLHLAPARSAPMATA
jgi:hypothetical protein